jgi:hypothetical protein
MNGDILGIHARPAASHEQDLMAFVRRPRVASSASVASCLDCARFSASDLLHWGFQVGGPCLRLWRIGGADNGRYALYPMSLIILIILLISIEFHTWISEVGV